MIDSPFTTKNHVVSDFNYLNQMKALVHDLAIQKGWYEQVETDGQFIARATCNMHGEISELWEAYRKDELSNPCDKEGCGLTCEQEEIADLIIRALDYCGRRGIDIGRAVHLKHEFNKTRPHRHGGKKA